jgi:hypothetical protein
VPNRIATGAYGWVNHPSENYPTGRLVGGSFAVFAQLIPQPATLSHNMGYLQMVWLGLAALVGIASIVYLCYAAIRKASHERLNRDMPRMSGSGMDLTEHRYGEKIVLCLAMAVLCGATFACVLFGRWILGAIGSLAFILVGIALLFRVFSSLKGYDPRNERAIR